MLLVQVCNNIEVSILEHKMSKKSCFTLQISALFLGEYFHLSMMLYLFRTIFFIFYRTNFLEQIEL